VRKSEKKGSHYFAFIIAFAMAFFINRYLCNEAVNQQLFCCICPAIWWTNLGNLLHTIRVMPNKTKKQLIFGFTPSIES